MRLLPLVLFTLLAACGTSEPAPVQSATDAADDTTDAGSDTAPVDKCATVKCGAPKVCDKVDGVCKGVRFTRLGEACGGDAGVCTGPAGATCLAGDFPDGYCSIVPCGVDNPCPIGAVCAKLGGKQACFAACDIDGECRGGVEYKCQDINQLVISGGRRKVCYLPAIPCTTTDECPKPLTCKDGKNCSAT